MDGEEDELVLRWAEERMKGVYELCTACKGSGYLTHHCSDCKGQGECIRDDYLEAEIALTDELFVRLGPRQMVTGRANVNRHILLGEALEPIPAPRRINSTFGVDDSGRGS